MFDLSLAGRTIEQTLTYALPAHLGVLQALTHKELRQAAKVYAYDNGREHGSYVKHAGRVVAFATYRNSDKIVVYCGKEHDFDEGYPSESVYAHKKFFAAGAFEEAAKFITAYLLE